MSTTLLESRTPIKSRGQPLVASSSCDAFQDASGKSSLKMSDQDFIPRLLYRGALSLPDSHILLDGLTFTINLPSDSTASVKLLETPLPLALESMRGLPSLCFGGIVKMENVYYEDDSEVRLHVHPRSILTHQLFTDTLCSKPVSPAGRTELGIRISLGQTESLPTSSSSSPAQQFQDIVVFGQPHPSSSTIMQLCVARILPRPAVKATRNKNAPRPPRPDDPTPRKPPATFGLARITVGMKRSKEKGKSKEKAADDSGPVKKKAKKDPKGTTKSDPTFKLPSIPSYKAAAVDSIDNEGWVLYDRTDIEPDLREEHKMKVKKVALDQLVAAGLPKSHTDFRELFDRVYRGAEFALRAKLGTLAFDAELKGATKKSRETMLDAVVQWHVKMYLTECPGIEAPPLPSGK